VFSAFGSKANLLKEAFDVRLAGDDEPLAIAQRPEAQRILAKTDADALLRAQADFYIIAALRVLPLWPAMTAGAATDPACAEVLAFFDRGRLEGPGEIVDVLARRGQLRKGLSRKKGKQAMYLLTSPHAIHDALDMGWKVEELQRWLGDCLVATLLDPPNPPPTRHSDPATP
jgi:hypothetical protein